MIQMFTSEVAFALTKTANASHVQQIEWEKVNRQKYHGCGCAWKSCIVSQVCCYQHHRFLNSVYCFPIWCTILCKRITIYKINMIETLTEVQKSEGKRTANGTEFINCHVVRSCRCLKCESWCYSSEFQRPSVVAQKALPQVEIHQISEAGDTQCASPEDNNQTGLCWRAQSFRYPGHCDSIGQNQHFEL